MKMLTKVPITIEPIMAMASGRWIDTAFALITLWLCGHTLNLMSAIGIIVTCGIVEVLLMPYGD